MEKNLEHFDLGIWKATFRNKVTEHAFLNHDLPITVRPISVSIVMLVLVMLGSFVIDYTIASKVAVSVMYRTLAVRLAGVFLCVSILALIRRNPSVSKNYRLIFLVVLTAVTVNMYLTFSYMPYLTHTDSSIWYAALLLYALSAFPVPLKISVLYSLFPAIGAFFYQTSVSGTPIYHPERFAALMFTFGAIGVAVAIRGNLSRRRNFVLLYEQQEINNRLKREVKERKRVETLLNARKEQLESYLLEAQRLESVGLLTGGIAHDFNNLLLPIMGFAEMAEIKLPADSDVIPFLHQITHAAKRARDMTRQLLAFGRKQVLEIKQVDLNELIRSFETMATRLIREDIELTLDLSSDLRPAVLDPSQIEQVLMNLVVNARDAMPGGGSITISTANIAPQDMEAASYLATSDESRASFADRSDMYVQITVSDTGAGIDPENVGHIFDPFFTTKPQGEGTGLGLAMVYGIVSQHEGRISVDSSPGEGTRIDVFLPSGTKALSKHSDIPSPLTNLNGEETILFVEDEDVVREFVCEVLEGYGYKVIAASNGQEALSITKDLSEPIDLLISDVVMPKLSGAELWKQLSCIRSEMKVLFISGYPNEDLGHHGVIADGTHLLQKPFSAEELAQKIRQILSID